MIVLIQGSTGLLSAKEVELGAEEQGLVRGPLRISADETTSREKGALVEASGNVRARYDMESGDVIETRSRFARYDRKANVGQLYGDPRAVWKRKEPGQPQTDLSAEKIILNVNEEGLTALGSVSVVQASSTLTAGEVRYLNADRKLVATGDRPTFDVVDPRHHTRISAEEIVALTDRRQINFNRKVSGTVLLSSDKP